jgi:hypothetical protein
MIPVYLLALLLGMLGLGLSSLTFRVTDAFDYDEPSSSLANWGAQGLGLQAKFGEANPDSTGREGVLGAVGEVSRGFESRDEDGLWRGKVRVKGEIWNAELKSNLPPVSAGTPVVVTKVVGLTVTVQRKKQR